MFKKFISMIGIDENIKDTIHRAGKNACSNCRNNVGMLDDDYLCVSDNSEWILSRFANPNDDCTAHDSTLKTRIVRGILSICSG